MKANIWLELETCLFTCSSYGILPSAADLMEAGSCQNPSASSLPPGPGIAVCHVLSVRLQAVLGASQLLSPFCLFFPFYSTLPCVFLPLPSQLTARYGLCAIHPFICLGFPLLNLSLSQSFLRLYFPAELCAFQTV